MSEIKKDENLQEEIEDTTKCCEEEGTCKDETIYEEKESGINFDITKLEEELKESEEKFLRVHADFENIKKRLEREKYQAIDYASEKFAKDLLTPLDTLEMALKSADTNISAEELLPKLKEGIELTMKSFLSVFEKHNILKVDTEGEFDPNIHDAVMRVDSDEHESGQIVSVLQKGYILKDRLLRPAMVSIAN